MSNQGASPVDYTTSVGQFRALIGDTDAEGVVAGEGEYAFYGDDAINGLLAVSGSNPKRAAAHAWRTIASTQALLLKKFSADDLSVDGPAIARELRQLAASLDEQADAEASVVDIFEVSAPDGTPELWPEGIPIEYGVRWGRAPERYGSGGGTEGWNVNPDGYIVNE